MTDQTTSPDGAKPEFELDRKVAVPRLIGDHKDLLIVSGLAGTSKDVAALTDDGSHAFTMAGAMGASTMIGLGLALARPDKRVLVVTGDGELLMNVGSLATVAVMAPSNLGILCVDNGHYGETGYQESHTSRGVDLEKMAIGAGIHVTCTVSDEAGLEQGARMLRQSNGPSFVLVRVNPEPPPAYKRLMEPSACRVRFRSALHGRP